MPAYIPPLTTCVTCGGDGKDEEDLCLTCYGTGATPLTKEGLFRKLTVEMLDDIYDKCNDIFEKVNE